MTLTAYLDFLNKCATQAAERSPKMHSDWMKGFEDGLCTAYTVAANGLKSFVLDQTTALPPTQPATPQSNPSGEAIRDTAA